MYVGFFPLRETAASPSIGVARVGTAYASLNLVGRKRLLDIDFFGGYCGGNGEGVFFLVLLVDFELGFFFVSFLFFTVGRDFECTFYATESRLDFTERSGETGCGGVDGVYRRKDARVGGGFGFGRDRGRIRFGEFAFLGYGSDF